MHLTESTKFKVSGYNSHHIHHKSEGRNRGLLIMSKLKLKVDLIIDPISCGTGVEVMGVTLHLKHQDIDIYNIYRSPNHGELDLGELFEHATLRPTIIAGDLNGHHSLFNPPLIAHKTDNTGVHIVDMLDSYPGIVMLNGNEETHEMGGNLDLIFASRMFATNAFWRISNQLYSDHFLDTLDF